MMILLLGAAGVIVVVASFLSKNAFKKQMVELRSNEDAYREKVSKFRAAQEAEALQTDDKSKSKMVDVAGISGIKVALLDAVRDARIYAPHRWTDPHVDFYYIAREGAVMAEPRRSNLPPTGRPERVSKAAQKVVK